MTLAELSAAVEDMQTSLQSLLGQVSLPVITIRPPTNDYNEASFLRLVAWSYVLFFEVGRITIPFLLRLPSSASPSQEGFTHDGRELVHDLRTWCFHNLDLNNPRDRAIQQRVYYWFEETCSALPRDDADWQECCHNLCTEIGTIVTHCQDVIGTVMSSPDDGKEIIEDLQRRCDRAWSAYQFDQIVGECCNSSWYFRRLTKIPRTPSSEMA